MLLYTALCRKNIQRLLVCGMLLVTACTYTQETTPTLPTQKKACVIFDLDGVVLHKPEIAPHLNEHKWKLAKAAISPALWAHVIRLLGNGAAGGQYQALFKKEYPELVDLVNQIMHSKKPMQETVALIQELAQEGYTLHIASNMDAEDFAFFEKKYPEIFSLFSVKKLIKYSDKPTEKPVKKPNPAYFQELVSELERTGEKKEILIFIDDIPKNVAAAEEVGLSGIVFKDVPQVRRELHRLNVLAAPTQ